MTTPPGEDRHRSRRNQRILLLLLIGIGSGAVAYLGWPCVRRGYCPGPGEALGTAIAAVFLAAWLLLPGSGRVLADERGLIIQRHRVPWAAIRSIAWVYEPRGKALLPRVEIGLRDVAGYKSPRMGRLRFEPEDLDLAPQEFWEMVQERAKPHHVIVLSMPPAQWTPWQA
jgi:hypothetical protein